MSDVSTILAHFNRLDKVRAEAEQVTGKIGDEDDTLFTAAVAVMTKKALGGDVKAFHELKDLMLVIEDQVKVDVTIEDDGLSQALENIAKGL